MINILKKIVEWVFDILRIRRNKLAEGEFGTGCRPQPVDPRDYKMSFGAGAFDWNTGYDVESELTKIWGVPFVLPTENQGTSSSCVGQASSIYASVLNYVERGKWEKLSARDDYSWIYLLGGGAYMRGGVARVVDTGILTEKMHPSYDGGNPPSESFMRIRFTEVPQYTDMVRDLTKSAEYVSVPATMDDIAKAMSMHFGVMIGVNGDNNGTWYSEFPKPPASRQWGHALYACKAKMINGKPYIGVKNSWGSSVGINGIQWLGAEWFSPLNVYDGWTLTDRKNQVDNDASFQKIDKIVTDPTHPLPKPDKSPYVDENWTHILGITGLTGITWGMYYDWSQIQKKRAEYGI